MPKRKQQPLIPTPHTYNLRSKKNRFDIINAMFDIPELGEMVVKNVLTNSEQDDQKKLSDLAFSGKLYPFFQPSRITSKLLSYVAGGYEERVKRLFEISPTHVRYATLRGSIYDYTGRLYPKVSAFELAVWSRDWDMVNLILTFLNKASANPDTCIIAEEIREELLKQWEGLERGDFHYIQNKQVVKGEKHFNLEPVLTAHQEYDNNYDRWNHLERETQFKKIGDMYRLFPIAMAQAFINHFNFIEPLSRNCYLLLEIGPYPRAWRFWGDTKATIIFAQNHQSATTVRFPEPVWEFNRNKIQIEALREARKQSFSTVENLLQKPPELSPAPIGLMGP